MLPYVKVCWGRSKTRDRDPEVRDAGSQGVENMGYCGVYVQNTGETLFRPTMKSTFCYFKLNSNSIGVKRN